MAYYSLFLLFAWFVFEVACGWPANSVPLLSCDWLPGFVFLCPAEVWCSGCSSHHPAQPAVDTGLNLVTPALWPAWSCKENLMIWLLRYSEVTELRWLVYLIFFGISSLFFFTSWMLHWTEGVSLTALYPSFQACPCNYQTAKLNIFLCSTSAKLASNA